MKQFFNFFAKVFLTVSILRLVINLFIGDREVNVLEYPVKQKANVFVEESLRPLLDTFLLEARIYKYSSTRIFYLDTIRFADLPATIGGQTSLFLKNDTLYGKIEINTKYNTGNINTRFILYHELGHWLGLKHESNIIMIEGYDFCDTAWTNMFQKDWNLLTYQYFRSLKSLQLTLRVRSTEIS